MDSPPEYQYSRIRRPFIRILMISSADACIGEERTLQGKLKVISLDNPEPFDAISYACGDPKPTERILIDGKTIMITKNCHDGLCYLRDELKVNTIWIDSISINAKDKAEKSDQIPLMTQIYGAARRVYIWLGKPTAASNRALDWLNDVSVDEYALLSIRIGQFPKNMHPKEIAKAFSILPDVIRARMRRIGLTKPLPECDQEALQEIVGRPWFTRMWTVQEAAMASEAWVVCGNRKVRWNRFFWSLVKAYENNPKNGPLATIDPLIVMSQFWLDISTILELRQSAHRKWVNKDSAFYRKLFGNDSRPYDKWQAFLDFMEQYGWKILYAELGVATSGMVIRLLRGFRPLDSIPLATLIWFSVLTLLLTPPKSNPHWDQQLRNSFIPVLRKTRIQQATEAKDKVYALYGLFEQLEIPLLAPPDYSPSHSLEDAYRSFTVSIIEWHCSLDVILEASGPWGTDAPSWVPDWSRTYKRVQISSAEMEVSTAWKQDAFSFSDDLRELKVSGKYAGVVVSVAESLECGEIGSVSPSQAHENAMILSAWVKNVTEMHHFPVDEISNFLISVFAHGTTYAHVDFNKWLELLLDEKPEIERDSSGIELHHVQSNPPAARKLNRLSAAMQPQPLSNLTQDEKVWQLHNHICSNLAGGMTVFAAAFEDGKVNVLGIGPDHVRPHDTIVRFATPSAPMIMRATESYRGKYHVVGASRLSQMSMPAKGTTNHGNAKDEIFTIV